MYLIPHFLIEDAHHPKIIPHLSFIVNHGPNLQTLANVDPFPITIIPPFPDCHINGSTDDKISWIWLLSLSRMHLIFIHIVEWINSSVFVLLNKYSLVWMHHNLFIYSVWKTFGLFLTFRNTKKYLWTLQVRFLSKDKVPFLLDKHLGVGLPVRVCFTL